MFRWHRWHEMRVFPLRNAHFVSAIGTTGYGMESFLTIL
jgi:hypothetical protein